MSKELIERLRNAAIFATSECAWLMTEAADALEAKAAPVGEREAFEAHMRVGGYSNPDKHPDGSYVSSAMELWWQGWKARAAYQRAQQAQATDWKASGADWCSSIHRNPDAKAWADFFVATFPGLADKHDLMLGWFANAMMAMHDYLKAQQPQSAEAVAYVLTRDGEVCYEAGDGIVISNTPGDETDLYNWQPVYFTTPLPSAGVVMPERKVAQHGDVLSFQGEGWNACLDEFARLNGKEVGRG